MICDSGSWLLWAAARRFGGSESFAIKLLQRWDLHGSLCALPQGRPRCGGKLDRVEDYLVGMVEAEPHITMPELAARLMAQHGVQATPAMVSRFLCQRGFTYKKLCWHRNAGALTLRQVERSADACVNSPAALCSSTKRV